MTIENIRKAIRKYSLKSMIVTKDADGVVYVDDEDVIDIKATAKEVKDVNGAGDTLMALFACYFDPDNVRRSLEIANAGAGIAVSQFGTYAVTHEDLIRVRNDIKAVEHVIRETAGEKTTDIKSAEDSKNGDGFVDEMSKNNYFSIDINEKIKHNKTDANGINGSKTQDKTIVFTNGCFDVMHIGHIQLLKYAKR